MELWHATTEDGIRLEGLFEPPALEEVQAAPLVCIHGTGSNCYASRLFGGLVPRLRESGHPVLRINTRGRDMAYQTPGPEGLVTLGSSFERVDDCRLDLQAWVELLAHRGLTRPILVGHSLGAVKALYAMAAERPPAVAAVAALSPPRLSHAAFAAGKHSGVFLAEYERCRARAAEGRADDLERVTFPLPYWITAAGYLDKYGPEERYNLLRWVDRVRVPTLFTFGAWELNQAAFEGLPAELDRLAGDRPAFRTAVVAGADHQYNGCHAELAALVHRFARTLSIPAPTP